MCRRRFLEAWPPAAHVRRRQGGPGQVGAGQGEEGHISVWLPSIHRPGVGRLLPLLQTPASGNVSILRRGNVVWPLHRPIFCDVSPRQCNPHSRTTNPVAPDASDFKDAGASGAGSHAGAWERSPRQYRLNPGGNRIFHCDGSRALACGRGAARRFTFPQLAIILLAQTKLLLYLLVCKFNQVGTWMHGND